jgi:hypothetical protein
MAYFKQLTGSKLPKPVAKKFKVGDNKFEYGVIYKIKTDKGYFTLRNKSCVSSSQNTRLMTICNCRLHIYLNSSFKFNLLSIFKS